MSGIAPEWERFWRHVSRGAPDACWLWRASTREGYGAFSGRRNGRNYRTDAHRWLWEYLRGPIPDGMVLDHLCDTPRCVNPDHLEMVTSTENIRRGRHSKRARRSETRGDQLRLFDPEELTR